MSPIQELFTDKNQCFREICEVRKLIGHREATHTTFEAAIQTLGFILLYCPVEILPIVESQIEETQRRHSFFILHECGLI